MATTLMRASRRPRQPYDEPKRENVTDGRRMAGGALRGRSHTIAGGGLSAPSSASEADDAVQEAWLRLNRADTSAVEHLSGWLTTGVARTARDTVSRNA